MNRQWQWGATAHTLAVLGLVMLAVIGLSPESLGGIDSVYATVDRARAGAAQAE
jgi:hypothetical protein